MRTNKGKQRTPTFYYTCRLNLLNIPNEGILLMYLPKYQQLALCPVLFHIKFNYQKLNILCKPLLNSI